MGKYLQEVMAKYGIPDRTEEIRQQQQQALFDSFDWADGTTDEEKIRAIETIRQNATLANKGIDIANTMIEAAKTPAKLTLGEKLGVVGEVAKEMVSDTGEWDAGKAWRLPISSAKGAIKGLGILAAENFDTNPMMGGLPGIIIKDHFNLKSTGTNLTPTARAMDQYWDQKIEPAANELLGLKDTNLEKTLGVFGEFLPSILTGAGAVGVGERALTKVAPKLAENAAAKYLAGDAALMLENYAITQTPKTAEERESLPEFAAMWMAPNLAFKGLGKAASAVKGRGAKAPVQASESFDYLDLADVSGEEAGGALYNPAGRSATPQEIQSALRSTLGPDTITNKKPVAGLADVDLSFNAGEVGRYTGPKPKTYYELMEELRPEIQELITPPRERSKVLVGYIYDGLDGAISKNEIRRMKYAQLSSLAQDIANQRKADLYGLARDLARKKGYDLDNLYRMEADPGYAAERTRMAEVANVPRQTINLKRSGFDEELTIKNIASGQAAMDKVIGSQADALNAMYRPDLGDISFYWGDSKSGVRHIIEGRNKQGFNGEQVARKMVDVIARGERGPFYGPEGWTRVNITHDGHTAVLSLYRDLNKETWLLTGWENSKRASDVTGKGDGLLGTTQSGPMRTRPGEGADALTENIPPDITKGNGGQGSDLKLQPREIKTLNKEVADSHFFGLIKTGKVKHAPEAMQNPEFVAANNLSKSLSGREVIPFKGREDVHGASDGQNIWLNAESKQPLLYVAGHELTHDLQTRSPEVYSRLEAIAREHIADSEGLSAHYKRQGYTPEQLHRELTADAMAESMMDSSFWARVRQQSPELLKPLLDALDSLINRFRQAIGEDMTILPYLRDVEIMRNRLADEYGGYLADMKAGKVSRPTEIAAKRDMAFKFSEQGSTSPVDDVRSMIIKGAEHVYKGGYSHWLKLMEKDFPEAFNRSYSEKLLGDVWYKARELKKTGQTSVKFGGQEVPITRAELNAPAPRPGVPQSAQTVLRYQGQEVPIVKGVPFENGQKPRSLDVSAANSPWASPEYVDRLAQDIAPNEIGAYDPITNKQTIADAQAALAKDPGAVVRRILDESWASDRVDNTAGLMLVKAANNSGDINLAVDITEALAKKATEAGQAIQALSMWGKLTPEGMLTYGQKVIARANQELLKKGVKKPIKLDEDAANKILQYMKEAEKLEGDAKNVKVQQALGIIAEQVPPSVGKKIATFQTMMQLLNLKTATRNIIGNLGFGVMDNLSDVVGSGIDKLISGATKNRTKVFPSLITQSKGFIEGGKKGIRDANLGIDTSNMGAGKFDIPTQRVFTRGPLSKLEKAMNYELRVPDRAFYQAAYNESLRQQIAAAAKSKAPREMKAMEEQAHHDALYRTFQDDSLAAQAFTKVKNALNLGKGFGLGDFVLKYPKTPANLLMRGIEYSPAGFIKSVIELGRPLFGREFNQKAFVEVTSRALVGSTALVGTGAILHELGIITGGPDEDRDVENLKTQAGFGQYRINVSGLKRFIASGFNPNEAKLRSGDITVSYDWFQPNSIGLAMGADIDKNKNQKKGIVGNLAGMPSLLINGLSTGINAFAEQPVISGLMQITGYNDLFAGLANALQGVPASFVPTLFNQIKQLMDNDKRSTYSPDYFAETKNKAINKIPGLSETLPQQYGTFGQPLKTYQEGSGLTENNPFNALINPAFVNRYNPMPEAQKVLDIYNLSGENAVLPPVKQRYITYTPAGGKKSERIDLTPNEYAIYQQIAGDYARQQIAKLNVTGDAATMVKKMNGIISDASDRAKDTILNARGIKRKK